MVVQGSFHSLVQLARREQIPVREILRESSELCQADLRLFSPAFPHKMKLARTTHDRVVAVWVVKAHRTAEWSCGLLCLSELRAGPDGVTCNGRRKTISPISGTSAVRGLDLR